MHNETKTRCTACRVGTEAARLDVYGHCETCAAKRLRDLRVSMQSVTAQQAARGEFRAPWEG